MVDQRSKSIRIRSEVICMLLQVKFLIPCYLFAEQAFLAVQLERRVSYLHV